MLPLSVVIITCNEERIIGKTLAAVAPFAAEIIIVDSGSTDHTVEIAKQHKALCHYQQWPGYAAQKNYALSLATKSWILSLDADEVVSDALAKEITTLLLAVPEQALVRAGGDARAAEKNQQMQQPAQRSTQLYDGYRIPRLLFIGDTALKCGGFYPDAQLRLFKNGKGKFIERKVHESVQVEGKTGNLHSPLLHYSYNDFAEYAATLDRYAQLSAEEFLDKKTNWRSSKLNEMFHPIWTFSYRYFLRLGFLDGIAGLKANLIYQDYVRKKITYLRAMQQK